MTHYDTGKDIRLLLKKNGYSNRDIGIRMECCGYSTAIRATIKKLTINLHEIETLLIPFKSVSRCERTGEVLEGGNTYLFVSYDTDIVENCAYTLLPEAEAIWQYVSQNRTDSLIKIIETKDIELFLTPYDDESKRSYLRMKKKAESEPTWINSTGHAFYIPFCLAEFLATFKAQNELTYCLPL